MRRFFDAKNRDRSFNILKHLFGSSFFVIVATVVGILILITDSTPVLGITLLLIVAIILTIGLFYFRKISESSVYTYETINLLDEYDIQSDDGRTGSFLKKRELKLLKSTNTCSMILEHDEEIFHGSANYRYAIFDNRIVFYLGPSHKPGEEVLIQYQVKRIPEFAQKRIAIINEGFVRDVNAVIKFSSGLYSDSPPQVSLIELKHGVELKKDQVPNNSNQKKYLSMTEEHPWKILWKEQKIKPDSDHIISWR